MCNQIKAEQHFQALEPSEHLQFGLPGDVPTNSTTIQPSALQGFQSRPEVGTRTALRPMFLMATKSSYVL